MSNKRPGRLPGRRPEPVGRPSRLGSTWRRPAIVGGAALAILAVVGFAALGPRSSSVEAWSRLGTEDVHSLAFVDGDPQRLLFGHHRGVLSSTDGGLNWQPLGTRSDAMGLGVSAGGSIVIAGHEVFTESSDGGRTWTDVQSDLPSLDIHGFARDPGDPARMWVYLAIGGLWESLDAGRTWEQVQQDSIVLPVAIEGQGGTRLIGVTSGGIGRSDDGGRTWQLMSDPGLYPVTGLAAASGGSTLIASGLDLVMRSDDGGATWSKLPFEGQPAVVAITDSGRTIALVTRSTDFFRSDDGGETWPGP